jgi:hypothetical protein
MAMDANVNTEPVADGTGPAIRLDCSRLVDCQTGRPWKPAKPQCIRDPSYESGKVGHRMGWY